MATTNARWDAAGALAGVAFVVLDIAGLSQFRAGPPWPGLSASTDQALTYVSAPRPALAQLGFALILCSFVFLLVFFARLWATLRSAEGGSGWLSLAALGGAIIYITMEFARFTVTGISPPQHALEPQEGALLYDLGNELTVFTWTAIALFLLPASVVALRNNALPRWLGGAALVVGIANLAMGLLPPSGPFTVPELAFVLWVAVTAVVLLRRPLRPAS